MPCRPSKTFSGRASNGIKPVNATSRRLLRSVTLCIAIARIRVMHKTGAPHSQNDMAMDDSKANLTQLLSSASEGDSLAADKLVALLYEDLRRLSAHYLRAEAPNHSWDSADLVDEVYMKFVKQGGIQWKDKAHFTALAAQAMRRLLVDHARAKKREKRGGQRKRLELDEQIMVSHRCDDDLLAVDEAIEKLAKLDPTHARLVELRFFGNLSMQEVAEVLGVSKRTAEREWTMVRAWLRRELGDELEHA